MILLWDSDIFFKIALCGLFEHSTAALGVQRGYRLPALPFMLSKRFKKVYGDDACSRVKPLADALPVIPSAQDSWLEIMRPLHEMDPGEAHLFAAGCECSCLIATGDKRALRSLATLEAPSRLLAGRIVVLEALLMRLCKTIGPQNLQLAVTPHPKIDTMMSVCFAGAAPDVMGGLTSYFDSLKREVNPLLLWDPNGDRQ